MNIRFFGSASSIPEVGNDCPCYLIDDKYLVDCGYNVLSGLRLSNTDLSKIEYIIFTHMHHDHYIGLAGLLFFFLQSKIKDISSLTFIGPETMPEVLKRTYSFLQLDKFFVDTKMPKEIVISPDEIFENDEVVLKAGSCYHPGPARCYRIESKIDNKVLAVSGDTSFNENMVDLFKNADAIIHDCSLGLNYIYEKPVCGHSSVYDALSICEQADISILFPVHLNDNVCKEIIEKVQPETKTKMVFPTRDMDFILY